MSLFRRDNIFTEKAIVCIENSICKKWFEVLLQAVDYNNYASGVVWITCGILWCFYQLFGLSFWRYPLTAEDPLIGNWCNAKFLQICSNEETVPFNLVYRVIPWDNKIKTSTRSPQFKAIYSFKHHNELTKNTPQWCVVILTRTQCYHIRWNRYSTISQHSNMLRVAFFGILMY